jgi:membrane associated rhomboid family serine protease
MPSAPSNDVAPWWMEDDTEGGVLNENENKNNDEDEDDDDDENVPSCDVASLYVDDTRNRRSRTDSETVHAPPRSSKTTGKPPVAAAAGAVRSTTLNPPSMSRSSTSSPPLPSSPSWQTKLTLKASDTWTWIKSSINSTTTFPKAEASMTSTSTSGAPHRDSSHSSSSSSHNFQRYTVQELIQSLGQGGAINDIPPALERRVRDFKFAQQKRRERAGGNTQRAWGIFGLYAHLSDIRADLEWAEDAAWRRQQSQPYLSWTDFEKGRDKGMNNRPWFTYSLLAICTIMMFVAWGVNGWKMEPLKVNPLIGPSSETLIKVGARQSDLIVNHGQYFRLFTPLVLHAGWIHYVINMMALYFIGGAFEQSHGWLSACVLFIVPAVGGNILSAICLPQYISVGASGGIFGLIGGCLADIAINWNLLFLKSTTEEGDRWRHGMVLFWLILDILLNCIIGLTPYVDNFTHLGGLIYGLLCGLSTIEKMAVGFFGLQSDQLSWKMYLTRFLGLITSVVAIMITTVVLVQSDGVTSSCSGCRYISCVPFPPNAEERWWECDDCDFVTADLFVRPEDGLYEEIALTCPDGQIEVIEVATRGWFDKEQVREALPSFCRDQCENVFATKQG